MTRHNLEMTSPQTHSLDLTRLMQGLGQGIMWATVTKSLAGFMFLPVAAALAALLVWLFKCMLDIALTAAAPKLVRAVATMVALLLAALTIGMSGSALWSMNFAQSSLAGFFERNRVGVERQLVSTLNLTQSAQRAMQDWAAATKERASVEANQGGSCPLMAQTAHGVRGPVHAFRLADQTIAKSLANDLQFSQGLLESTLAALKGAPKASTFAEVKVGLEAANAAIEAAFPLTDGGAVASSALKELDARLKEPVSRDADGVAQMCGDQARDQLIGKAIAAFDALNKTQKMNRLSTPVDLANPRDVVVRGWLRAGNMVAAAIPFANVTTFKDDSLWKDASERQGWVHSEKLPYLMVSVVELGVVMTTLWSKLRGSGQQPFPSTVVQTAQAVLARQRSTTGWRGALDTFQKVLVKAWCNVLYNAKSNASEPITADVIPSGSGDDLDSDGMPVKLPANPVYGPKAEAMAKSVLPFYVDWGSCKVVIIPRLPEARCEQAHRMARHLANHGQLSLRTATATVNQLDAHPSAGLVLDDALSGQNWRQAGPVEVWEVASPFDAYLDYLSTQDHILAVSSVNRAPTDFSRNSLKRLSFKRKLVRRAAGLEI